MGLDQAAPPATEEGRAPESLPLLIHALAEARADRLEALLGLQESLIAAQRSLLSAQELLYRLGALPATRATLSLLLLALPA
jgi:hypothetical protein